MSDESMLGTLVVENFRSIRGRVVVPVNAPVVLIHGPNGTGKSSLMTALALALAGSRITDIAEPKHLVHHGAERAVITLGTSGDPMTMNIAPTDAVVGQGLLDDRDAAFFSERCYLEQTKLTGLLERYQETSKGSAESALTRFVKELLRIDELDALVDGLDAAGNILRVANKLEAFKVSRTELPVLDKRIAALDAERRAASVTSDETNAALKALLVDMELADLSLDDHVSLEHAIQRHEGLETLARLETMVIRLEGLVRRRAELEALPGATTLDEAEKRLAAAQERREWWQQAHGDALGRVTVKLREEFPRLPPLESVPSGEVYDQALEGVDAERARISKVLEADDQTVIEEQRAQEALEAARGRLAVLDEELADESAPGLFGELSRVLADLVPHVVDDTCPVCGRDFGEVSNEPLSAHLAAEIARLSTRANQLQSAARARLATTSDVKRGEEEVARLSTTRLATERRSSEEQRLARMTALSSELREHERGAREGGAVMRDLVAAQAAVSEALGRDRAYVQWREELEQLTAATNEELRLAEPLEGPVALQDALGRQIEQLRAREKQRAELIRLLEEWRKREGQVRELDTERALIEARRARASQTVDAVTQRTENARKLLRRVEKIRRATITSVFNSALNEVWAELFIRLAPDEEYVPAFAEPSATGPVQAQLETRRRDGTQGGTPSEMLSAGNLNTAALTLFFALHLSVRRRVPWLLLDDPVQSMDEIHVAQFAALLRTLTQQEPQRRVFIAVHDRALFEYLALELTPATPAGGLVTVELRRGRAGQDSTALPKSWPYTPDTVLSAA